MKPIVSIPDLSQFLFRRKAVSFAEDDGRFFGTLELVLENRMLHRQQVAFDTFPDRLRVYVNEQPYDAFGMNMRVGPMGFSAFDSPEITVEYQIGPSKPKLHPAEVLRRKRKAAMTD